MCVLILSKWKICKIVLINRDAIMRHPIWYLALVCSAPMAIVARVEDFGYYVDECTKKKRSLVNKLSPNQSSKGLHPSVKFLDILQVNWCLL